LFLRREDQGVQDINPCAGCCFLFRKILPFWGESPKIVWAGGRALYFFSELDGKIDENIVYKKKVKPKKVI